MKERRVQVEMEAKEGRQGNEGEEGNTWSGSRREGKARKGR